MSTTKNKQKRENFIYTIMKCLQISEQKKRILLIELQHPEVAKANWSLLMLMKVQ